MAYLDTHGMQTLWSKIKSYVSEHSGNAQVIITQNVQSSSWSNTDTYEDYPFRASLPVSGMTTSHIPEVVFDGTNDATDNIATHCESYNGGVYIFASDNVGVVTAQTVAGIKQG